MNTEKLKSNAFIQAVVNYFRNYFNFSGKTGRKEFLYVVLFRSLFHIIFYLIFFSFKSAYPTIHLIEQLFFLIPTLSLTSRRFRDASGSPWWIMIPLLFTVSISNSAIMVGISMHDSESVQMFSIVLSIWSYLYWFAGFFPSKNAKPVAKKKGNPVPSFIETADQNQNTKNTKNANSQVSIDGYQGFINIVGILISLILMAIAFAQNLTGPLLLLAFGAFIFVPIILTFLVAVIVGLMVGFAKTKNKINQSSLNAQEKKKLFHRIRVNLAIYPIIWVIILAISVPVKSLKWNSFTAKASPVIEKGLTKQYQKAGFKNFKIKVTNIQDYDTEASTDLYVDYKYIEKINGKTYQHTERTKADHDTYKPTEEVISKKPSDQYVCSNVAPTNEITYYAAYQQPAVKKQLAYETKKIKPFCRADQSFEPIIGDLNDDDYKKFNVLAKIIKANQKAGKPVGGYYNLNVKDLAAQNVLLYRIELKQNRSWNKQEMNETIGRLKKIDYKNFWPGIYRVRLNYKTNGYWDLYDHYIKFTVKNGKASNFKIVEIM